MDASEPGLRQEAGEASPGPAVTQAAPVDQDAGVPDSFARPIEPPSLSLPKGGGAIRGIGEKFAVDAATGTASMTIPLPLSPGRGGMQPQLSLAYDSGAGNGPWGIGWSAGAGAVTRKTDKGLPRYVESGPDADVFLFSGAEDLVPVLDPAAGWTHPAPVRALADGSRWIVERYRPRIERLYARIERWTPVAGGPAHWRSISKEGVVSLYGTSAESRISDGEHVFSWLVSETVDLKGNAMLFRYAAEDSTGVDGALAHERNRDAATRSRSRYLKRILYGNATPHVDGEDLTARDDWLFELVLDYGEHDPSTPLPSDAGPWPVRQDPFSSYRAGFEVRTYRLCRRLLMFHHFPDEPNVGRDCLVRSLDLEYDEGPVATKLVRVTQSGYRRSQAGYVKRSFPPLELEYSTAQPTGDVIEVDAENLPQGLGGTYRLVDLDGEGLPGILTEQADAWLYKRNVSPLAATAAFAPLEVVASRPTVSDLERGKQQLLDVQGDGRIELAQFAQPAAGYFSRTDDGGWESFETFPSLPNLAWDDPNLRFVDLTGDGLADVVVTGENVIRWHASLAADGFDVERRAPQSFDEEEGPRLVFADGTQSIYLADLSGDGLTDLVRVRNGEVSYWPNVGYGQFGAKVSMDNAPVFDTPDAFDQRRLRLADIDGSGPVDLVYVGRSGVQLYANQSGNAFSDLQLLDVLPDQADPTAVTFADLCGNGISCLVWSSTLPGDARAPLRYLDLMGGVKPHLLTRVDNNLGAETLIGYAPSTKFYVQDRAAGHPWITRLGFPVHVVERVQTRDHISDNLFVTRYAYHHGFFDGVEREFRGFALVEQWDTEEFSSLTADGELPASNVDLASQVPPTLTRTWFHTGFYRDGARISKQLAHEYYREGNADGLTPLSDQQAAAMEVADTALPTSILMQDGTREPYVLLPDEEREACRSLKGTMLRQELYGLDGTGAEHRPYTVAERNYTIELLQPRGPNQHAVFVAHAREAVDFNYERSLFTVDGNAVADPRVTHRLTVDVDVFGNVLESASVAYGRRYDDPDPELTADDRQAQKRVLATMLELSYTNAVDDADGYRVPALCETRGYEVVKVEPDSAIPGTTNLFAFDELVGKLAQAGDGAHELAVGDVFSAGAVGGHPYRRLLRRGRAIFRRDDLTGPLPLGSLELLALPYEGFHLAFTPDLLAAFRRRRPDGTVESLVSPPATFLGGDSGYVRDGDLQAAGVFPVSPNVDDWWIPTGRVHFSPGAADPANVELAYAEAHFYTAARYEDPFGNATAVAHDAYSLLAVDVVDALDNHIGAANDYRVLQPALIADPNGNRRTVLYDALGFVAAVAVMGKEGENAGDTLDAVDPDPGDAAIAAHLADPLADAEALLGDATQRYLYDLGAYARTRGDPAPSPTVSCSLMRETHVADLAEGEHPRIQQRFAYSDGFGRHIQVKAQAEPDGGNPRWIGNGWRIYNNKGDPVRQYEPFFTATHRFEAGLTVGVSSIILYDPVRRAAATIRPNHAWEKVVHDAWRQETWDVNDTTLIDDPAGDPDVGASISRLLPTAYLPTWRLARSSGALGADEQAAAQKAAAHAATPLVAYFDSLGRAFMTVSHNRYPDPNGNTIDVKSAARLRLDIEGNHCESTDSLGRLVERAIYGLSRSRIYDASMDGGERWILNDVVGKLRYAWDSRGHALSTAYDELRRPAEIHLADWAGLDAIVQRTIYGESQASPEASNLRGKPFEILDGAGELTTALYDFKGNALSSRRRLAAEYRQLVDWSQPVNLDGDYLASTTYDALDRPVAMTAPDGSVAVHSYNEAGLLERLEVTVQGDAAPTAFVQDVDYDAKGQRTSVLYGNGATTTYDYDPLTFRLVRLRTGRGAAYPGDCPNAGVPPCGLQNLSYVYDAAGNVVSIVDDAQQTIFFRNQRVDPRADFTYDALYRLVIASGREHLGQNGGTVLSPVPTSQDDAPRTGLLSPADGNAMGRYSEYYSYDSVGNLLDVAHRGTDPAQPGWHRAYTYASPSLLDATQAGNRLTSSQVGNGPVEPYSYDEHGNLAHMPQLPLAVWDYRDRLAASSQQVVNAGTPETTFYTYDAEGRRARKVTDRQAGAEVDPTRMKERVYVGGFEIYREFDATGTVAVLERETLHITDATTRVALVEIRTIGVDPGPARLTRYQLANHLGSAQLELADDASVISYEEYYPWGGTSFQAVRSQTETPRRYRYAAKERDEESGLYYFGSRYYLSWLGRWASCDPAGFADGSNLYAYSRNNPITLTDPNGRQTQAGDLVPQLSIDTGGRVTWNPYRSDPASCGLTTFQLWPGTTTYTTRVEVLGSGGGTPTDTGGGAGPGTSSGTSTSAPEPERSFWSRGGKTLLAGAGLVLIGAIGIATGGTALIVLLPAAMALSAGIAGTAIGATQLGMSYSGQTNASQDEEINRASSFMMSMTSSPTGLLAGTTAVAVTGDMNRAQQWADYGSLAEGGFTILNSGGRMALREFEFGTTASDVWRNRALQRELRSTFDVSEDVALRSRFNPAFPRNTEYIEFSHWMPQRWGRRLGAEWLFNRPWNLTPMWGTEHALVDSYRLGFLKQPFQNALRAEAYTGLELQLRLAPTWVPQTAIGAGRVGLGLTLTPPTLTPTQANDQQ